MQKNPLHGYFWKCIKNICAICYLSRHGASVLSSSRLLSSAEHHKLEQQRQSKKTERRKREGIEGGEGYIFGILILYMPLFITLRVWLLFSQGCTVLFFGGECTIRRFAKDSPMCSWIEFSFLHVDFNLVAVMVRVNCNLITVPGLGMLCMWGVQLGMILV